MPEGKEKNDDNFSTSFSMTQTFDGSLIHSGDI